MSGWRLKTLFAGIDKRVAWLRGTLLTACFLGLLVSTPAWLNTRSFPLVPIVPWFPILPPPADKILFGAMLAALVLSVWFYRQGVIAFLVLSFFAFCEDQNRGQPWMYMYWVMLLLSLAPGPVAVAAVRLSLSVVYLWSGIQKLNAKFFEVVPGWFVAPAKAWHFPDALIQILKTSVTFAPFIEISIAIFLWVPRARRVTILVVAVLHAVSLLFLSPVGHNYNWVVWPWNLAMIALAWGLFSSSRWFRDTAPIEKTAQPVRPRASKKQAEQSVATAITTFRQTVRLVGGARLTAVVLILYALLPALSFAGRWDSYFSFSLYAENAAHANFFVTQDFADRLPASLRKYAQKFPQAYDPIHQGPLILGVDPWCYEELHVPAIPEERNFKAIYRHLRKYAPKPRDLRLIIGPRAGPVIFLEGDEVQLLKPK